MEESELINIVKCRIAVKNWRTVEMWMCCGYNHCKTKWHALLDCDCKILMHVEGNRQNQIHC